MNEFIDMFVRDFNARAYELKALQIEKVIYSGPATIVVWSDDTKTVVKCMEGDAYDMEKALLLAILKKLNHNSATGAKRFLSKWVPTNIPTELEDGTPIDIDKITVVRCNPGDDGIGTISFVEKKRKKPSALNVGKVVSSFDVDSSTSTLCTPDMEVDYSSMKSGLSELSKAATEMVTEISEAVEEKPKKRKKRVSKKA